MFAFGVNGLGVLLCAWGILNPVGGALFHEFASLAVMLNALRLLWFERWDTTSLGRVVSRMATFADWLAERLSPSRTVQWLLSQRRLVVRLAATLGLVWYLTSNCVLLTEDEQALVTRFGRYENTLSAGFYWRWPQPFERVRRKQVDKVRLLQLGFRAEKGAVGAGGMFVRPIEWQAEHAERGYRAMPAESSLLTGDEVAVELTAEARYRIRDTRDYFEGTSNPVAFLRAAIESATRQVVARRALEEILAEHRREVEIDCLETARALLAPYRSGIEITGFSLLDVHPPTAVVAAYRDVANAFEEHEQAINLARAKYARILLSTAGERAIRMLSDLNLPAGGRKHTALNSGGVADWKLNDEVWSALTAEQDGQMLLSGQAAARLLNADREKIKSVNQAKGQEARFTSIVPVFRDQPNLTRFQLYWETLEKALQNRPLTVLDPKATGRAHLYLADPERFNLNLLNMQPPLSPAAGPENEIPATTRPEREP